MGEQQRFSDDERAAIGDEAGIPWQRVCPFCGHHPAAVGTRESDEIVEEDGTIVLEDPWLGCPACSEEWQAPGVRYVLAEIPPLDSPEMDAFIDGFIAALRRSSAEGGGS